MNIIGRLRTRFRWWYARRYGEHPTCDVCGDHDAQFYTTDRGFTCFSCDLDYRPPPVAAARDIKPRDYLEDDPEFKS